MAKSVARNLQNEHLAALAADGAPFVDEEPTMLVNTKSLFDKITFRWRSDEASQLDRIRAAADTILARMYGDAKSIIDDFYGELRVPERNPDTGMVVRDWEGRVVWEKDERGREVEKWHQMTGEDIERCLLDLSRVRFDISSKVNELLLEAVFAKHIHDDQFQDAYAELVEETIPGRNAYAARKTRVDKYHAYFCFYLWSSAKVFQEEVVNFCWVLEKVRRWRIEGDKSGPPTSFV